MIPSDKKLLALLIVQVAAIVFLLFTGPLFIQNIPFLLMQVFGLLLIGWAVLAMNLNKPQTTNLPKGFFLITKGPYEIIRHPVYAGLLLVAAGFVQGYGSVSRFIVLAILIVITLVKITFEETFLEGKVNEYKDYQSKTHRLVPYLY